MQILSDISENQTFLASKIENIGSRVEANERRENKYLLLIKGIPLNIKDPKEAVKDIMYKLLEIRDFKQADIRDAKFIQKKKERTKMLLIDFIKYDSKMQIFKHVNKLGKKTYDGNRLQVSHYYTLKQQYERDAMLAIKKGCETLYTKHPEIMFTKTKKLDTYMYDHLVENKQKRHYSIYKNRLIELVRKFNCEQEFKSFLEKCEKCEEKAKKMIY